MIQYLALLALLNSASHIPRLECAPDRCKLIVTNDTRVMVDRFGIIQRYHLDKFSTRFWSSVMYQGLFITDSTPSDLKPFDEPTTEDIKFLIDNNRQGLARLP